MTDPLLEPLVFRNGRVAPNRFWLAPMTNKSSHPDGHLSEDELRFLTARAEGSFGVVETCATHVSIEGQGWENEFGIFDDVLTPDWRRLAAAVQEHDVLLLAQLFHGGARALRGEDRPLPWSASASDEEDAPVRRGREADILAGIDFLIVVVGLFGMAELLTLVEQQARDDWHRWWQRFEDPALNRLVERASEDNLELAIQLARIREARAQLGFADAERFPTVGYQAEANRERTPGAALPIDVQPVQELLTSTNNVQELLTSTNNQYSLAASLEYEIDLWGRLANQRAAAMAALQESLFARDAAELGVMAGADPCVVGLTLELCNVRLNSYAAADRSDDCGGAGRAQSTHDRSDDCVSAGRAPGHCQSTHDCVGAGRAPGHCQSTHAAWYVV